MLKPPLCLIIVHLEGYFHEKSSAVGINGLLDSVESAVYEQNCGKGDLTLIVFGAALKVEQNPEKLKKCSTAGSKSGARGSESRTKSRKIEKMFYRRLQNRPARPQK